jgi:hypothetical protein
MARQTGLINLKGTLGNVNFYKTKDGNLARMKTSVDASRIASDPAFERTRENNAEFGNFAAAGKLFRDSVRAMALNASDGRVTARVTQRMSKIKNLDTISERGQRNVATGLSDPSALGLLKGFDFNNRSVMSSVLYKAFSVDTGTGEITIVDFNPMLDLASPQGATHIRFSAGVAGVDFELNERELVTSDEFTLAINSGVSTVSITPNGMPSVGAITLYLLKIEFLQEINGNLYALKNGAYNALRVVEVQ